MMRNLTIVTLACLTTSCSLFSPVKSDPPKEYVIDTVPHVAVKKRTHPITIQVTDPKSSHVYNTTDMAYEKQRHQVSYFAKNQWAATPSQMLKPLLITTLQNTHYFHAVVSSTEIGNYDLTLNTEILEFQQDFLTSPSTMHVVLRAQIVRAATNHIVASKQFSAIVPAPENTPYGGVVAANRAVSKILAEISTWVLRQH